MNDKPQIKLSETVVLIDAAFLNFVITDMKGYFEDTLQRSLQEIDLSILTTYLTLDAGITEGKREQPCKRAAPFFDAYFSQHFSFILGFAVYCCRFG